MRKRNVSKNKHKETNIMEENCRGKDNEYNSNNAYYFM